MKPLEGIRVLDLTHAMAGPFATMWLADMGAEVIKVERPGTGDATRGYGPFINGRSAYFATLNRGKKYVSIDLKKPEGRELLLQLAAKCDILLNNFTPGVMDRLGLGYEAIRAMNRKIVYACISGFGQTGPYAHRPCYDIVGQAMGGIMAFTGFPNSEPQRVGASIGDVMAGMSSCVGMLAALYEAQQSGEGQIVDVSLVDSVVALCPQDYSCWFGGGSPPVQMGNQYRAWVPYGTYKAMDGYYIIGAGTEAHFRSFCNTVLERPDMAQNPEYCDNPHRVAHRAEIDAVINAWAADKHVDDICAKLRAAGVPFGKINNAADVEAAPQTKARQMIVTQYSDEMGELKMINCPIRFPGNEPEEYHPGAVKPIGGDNESVLSSMLGFDAAATTALTQQGILFQE